MHAKDNDFGLQQQLAALILLSLCNIQNNPSSNIHNGLMILYNVIGNLKVQFYKV